MELTYEAAQQIKSLYGLSPEKFMIMWTNQNGVCAICSERMDPPCVDHDHETGHVRKLLCRKCNTGLGMFKDDIRLLAGAIVYLQDHGLGITE